MRFSLATLGFATAFGGCGGPLTDLESGSTVGTGDGQPITVEMQCNSHGTGQSIIVKIDPQYGVREAAAIVTGTTHFRVPLSTDPANATYNVLGPSYTCKEVKAGARVIVENDQDNCKCRVAN